MGTKFRKSIKIAPGVKVNINKKSVGLTVGKKGMHHTVNSSGKRTTTVGLPGTGLSYSKTTSSRNTKSASSKNTKSAIPTHMDSSKTHTPHQMKTIENTPDTKIPATSRRYSPNTYRICGIIFYVLSAFCILLGLITFAVGGPFFLVFGVICFLLGRTYRKIYKNYSTTDNSK